jgi:hypothetical protein
MNTHVCYSLGASCTSPVEQPHTIWIPSKTATIPIDNWAPTNPDATLHITVDGSIDTCLDTALTLAKALRVKVEFHFNDRYVYVRSTSDLNLLRRQFFKGCHSIGP